MFPPFFPHRSRRAQGMTEYIIIVVVVAIFCIGIYSLFGQGITLQGSVATAKLTGSGGFAGHASTPHDMSFSDFIVNRQHGQTSFGPAAQHQRNRQNLMTGQ